MRRIAVVIVLVALAGCRAVPTKPTRPSKPLPTPADVTSVEFSLDEQRTWRKLPEPQALRVAELLSGMKEANFTGPADGTPWTPAATFGFLRVADKSGGRTVVRIIGSAGAIGLVVGDTEFHYSVPRTHIGDILAVIQQEARP